MDVPALSTLKVSDRGEISRFASLAPSIAAIVISLVVVVFIVWPKFSEVLRLRRANSELTSRVAQLEAKAQKLEVLDRDELTSQLAAAEQILPSDKSVFTFIAQVENFAKGTGVLLNRVEVAPGVLQGDQVANQPAIQAQPPGAVGGAQAVTAVSPKVQLKITLSSDYKSFISFLTAILNSARLVSVEDLTISSSSTSGGAGQVRTTLLVDAYWQSLPVELAAIETPVEDITETEAQILSRVASSGSVGSPVVSQVPLGRSDLFAPF